MSSSASGSLTTPERLFLESAQCLEGVESLSAFRDWFADYRQNHRFDVIRRGLEQLDGWHFQKDNGNLVHHTGRFFSIEGLDVRTNFGHVHHWMQPIINQPEIGILGFLCQRIKGVLHFLVQAKMEPGNVNGPQISPTVQATHSNYTQAHGGKQVPYLCWFLDRTRARCLVDQLQSEQGARFLAKRNRNMIVQVCENEPIKVEEGFFWLTLGQLFALLQEDNLVNMDSRTVLSCTRFTGDGFTAKYSRRTTDATAFGADILRSFQSRDREGLHDMYALTSWLTHMKTTYSLQVQRVPLNTVHDWFVEDGMIRHQKNRFFRVIGVEVAIDNREVSGWHQPLIESTKGGIICFLCQKHHDILHFLVQARVEPGNFDRLEMAPTIQLTPGNYDADHPEHLPPFTALLLESEGIQTRYDALQSEEGGRFYQDQNRYQVLELDPGRDLPLPPNYTWMTLRQMKEFIRFNNFFNIEARGLLSCLRPELPTCSPRLT
ncbi:NDP-hexose 2,3-dehydratase family protein [Desulfonatronum thioautotrophicum]|uniref:NDP-hexose 2,3-dehydratase family protein n=1 Tax=Desulfonatronum thioautotrophicum TaxID=617001 RepID=UPI0005EB0BF8|nr:NDP-hexose 2,3-dehydratase family protein [Desulfonatronum thioautotrophicum]